MRDFKLFHVKLDYFDGAEGAGAAPAAAEGPGEQGAKLLAEAASRNRANKKANAYANVVYGKQPEEQNAEGNAEGQAAADGKGVTTSERTLEERRKAYDEFRNSADYKEFFDRDMQNIIKKRVANAKELEKQVAESQPVIDMLMQRYGVKDTESLMSAIEGDSAYWQDAADEAGMSVSQYMEFQKLQRENRALIQQQEMVANQQKADAQLAQWTQEAEALKASYPNFSIEEEAQNPEFIRLLQSGLPMEHAYKVLHLDEILNDTRNTTAAFTQKQVIDNVMARGQRPQEAGLNSQNAITYKTDVESMSKGDILEIARRVKRGEKIVL